MDFQDSMLVIKKSEFTFFTVKYSLNTVKRSDQIWNLMNFWQSYRPTLYENTKLTQHDRKFPNITSKSISPFRSSLDHCQKQPLFCSLSPQMNFACFKTSREYM